MTTLNVRIEQKTKTAARKALRGMGLDLSSGVKLFLHQVVIQKGLPFTPTNDPRALRAAWDREFQEAKKRKRYKNAREVLQGL